MDVSPVHARVATLPRWTRFIVVNGRIPNASCVTCGTMIDRGYVRQPQTRLVYCDAHCLARHNNHAMEAPAAASRSQSGTLPLRRRSEVADKRSLGMIGLALAGATFAVVLIAAAVVQAQIGGGPDLERASERVTAAQALPPSE